MVTVQPAVWDGVIALARSWRRSSVVQEFNRQLPGNHQPPYPPLPKHLQALEAAGAPLSFIPLRFAQQWDFWHQMPSFSPIPSGRLLPQWLAQAAAIEPAYRATLGWLRSRLPGYPMLRAPQLVPGTQFTTLDYSEEAVWLLSEFREGLQFKSEPAQVELLLRLPRDEVGRIQLAARGLALALEDCPEWRHLASCRRRLSRQDIEDLHDCRSSLAPQLADEAVDTHAGHRAIKSHAYRQHVVTRAIASLQPSARRYVDAFQAATTLLDFAMDGVFQQLVAFGAPDTLVVGSNLERTRQGSRSHVQFTMQPDALPKLGQLAWVRGGLGDDPIQVEAVQFAMTQARGVSIQVRGRQVSGFWDAWARSNW